VDVVSFGAAAGSGAEAGVDEECPADVKRAPAKAALEMAITTTANTAKTRDRAVIAAGRKR